MLYLADGIDYLLLWHRSVDGSQDQHEPRHSGLAIGLQLPRGAGGVSHVKTVPGGGAVEVRVQRWVKSVKVSMTDQLCYWIGLSCVTGLHHSGS